MRAAVKKLEEGREMGNVEVIVVDNASRDGSIEYLEKMFPSVRFIQNGENLGFSKANNLGLKIASGQYILFLNPDTILPEPIFKDCISFFQSHSNVGGVGVRMVDGGGHFLVESKRGFPTAWRSFCKLSGLSAVFPTSQTFAGYNLGHLKERDVLPIDALAGAYMMVRKEVLEKIGGFDERFFMYAEDIDLSKRIKDAGFENYYLGDRTILHFKGESTKKDGLYVKRFYGAMNLYVMKHYAGFGSRISVGLMKAGISLRSLFAKTGIEKDKLGATEIHSIQYKGDERTISLLKKRWKGINENRDAKTMILCEGGDFPFSDLIETIQKLPETMDAMIHASGSNSVIGSFNKDQQGLAIALTSS